MTNTHNSIQVIEKIEEFCLVEGRSTDRYGHAYYVFLCSFNGLGELVPHLELTKWRQNAWRNRQLPCIPAGILKQAVETARKSATSLIFLGRDDVASIFTLRYRQKMTAQRKGAQIATEYAVKRLSLKSMTKADFSSVLVHLAIHGGAPKTKTLEGDTWKIIKLFRALCAL